MECNIGALGVSRRIFGFAWRRGLDFWVEGSAFDKGEFVQWSSEQVSEKDDARTLDKTEGESVLG